MRLVGITRLGRDLPPVQGPALVDSLPHAVEADQPGSRLGPQPNLLPESGDEVPVAPTHLVGDPADRHRTTGRDQPLPRPANLRQGSRPTLQPPQQELVQQPEPPSPARGLAQLLGQAAAGDAEHVDQVDELAAELIHGQAQERVGPQRHQPHLQVRGCAVALNHRSRATCPHDELGRAVGRVEDLHDQGDRGGCRQDQVSRGGRLGEAGIPARQHGPQLRVWGGGQPRPPRPLGRG